MTGHMRVGFHAPDTVEELAYLVAEAADTRTPLEVMGRGTKREVGRPVQYGAVLSTENLTGIQLYEPSELVLVARAGTPIGQIEQAPRTVIGTPLGDGIIRVVLAVREGPTLAIMMA